MIRPGLVVCLLALSLLYSRPANAQNERDAATDTAPAPGIQQGKRLPPRFEKTEVRIDSADAGFEALLETLHRTYRVDLLADDRPLTNKHDVHVHGTLKEALDQIADLYDYTWTLAARDGETVLFRKRFRSPEERPQLHESALIQMAKDVCSCLSMPLYVPGQEGEHRMLLWVLYHSFDEAQTQRLFAGKTLALDTLRPGQSLLLRQTIYNWSMKGMTDGWLHLRSRLINLKQAALTVEFSPSGNRLFALVVPRSEGGSEKVALRWLTPDTAFDANSNAASSQKKPVATPIITTPISSLRTDGSEEHSLRSIVSLDRNNIDLRSLVDQLAPEAGVSITAADYLEAHTFTVKVNRYTIARLLDLVVELNGWRLIDDKGKRFLVTGLAWHASDNLPDLPAELRKAIPLDFKRFFGIGMRYEDWYTGKDDERFRIFGGNAILAGQLARKAMDADRDDPTAKRIWPRIPEEANAGKLYKYDKWTPEDKEAVLWSLVALSIGETCRDGRIFDVLQGNLLPYERDPQLAEVQLSGELNGKFTGFGFGYRITRTEPKQSLFVGSFWELDKAMRPLPRYLQEAGTKYR